MMGGGLREHLNRQRLWYSDRRGMKNPAQRAPPAGSTAAKVWALALSGHSGCAASHLQSFVMLSLLCLMDKAQLVGN